MGNIFAVNGQHAGRRRALREEARMDRSARAMRLDAPERERPELVVQSWWPRMVLEPGLRCGLVLITTGGLKSRRLR